MSDELDLGATIRGMNPGQRVFKRYTLAKILGRGGMGVVWLARDEELEREVALKFLPETVAADRAAIDDLKREVRRAIGLAHPHIVKIHDFVTDGHTAAVAMEYIEGDTLASLRLDEPGKVFTAARLTPWVAQVTEALTYAHEKARVVHRDLKPANLMIDRAGDLKVLDFGIAASLSESVTRVSKTVGTSGTPLYMGPQQMMGEAPAVTDDIYALGATLYELLTGKAPFFSGRIEMQVMQKLPPRLAERRVELAVTEGGEIPTGWEMTIAACLAKDPAERPQSAAELAERLKGGKAEALNLDPGQLKGAQAAKTDGRGGGVNPSIPPTASLAQPHRKSKLAASVAIAAGVVGLAVAGWWFGMHLPEQRRVEAERLTIPSLDLEMLPIAAGAFQMGTATGGSTIERPLTRVTIARPFWLAKTEVTQRQWQLVMSNNPSHFKGENLPVEQVSWNEAMEYCRKLTEREGAAGRLPAGYAYSLPTEAQWEYAARAGTTRDYGGTGRMDTMGWYGDNSGQAPQPVGAKAANAWGLHDMHGNVWEWCLDWFGTYPGGTVVDPTGPSAGSHRVNRGGGWGGSADRCRAAYRSGSAPGGRLNSVGFRVALTPVS